MSDYPDRRPPELIAADTQMGVSAEMIEAWNYGYEWHEQHFSGPLETQKSPQWSIDNAPYKLWDQSPLANRFYAGFERATFNSLRAKILRAVIQEYDPVTEAENFLEQ
jgi:hypothetical protein